MSGKTNLIKELGTVRKKYSNQEDKLLKETKRILENDLLSKNKIIENLQQYFNTYKVLDEDEIDDSKIFSKKDIKKLAVYFRLKFLESKFYKPKIPNQAILKIENLNIVHKKELQEFFILSLPQSFNNPTSEENALLFIKTNLDNYYLVHQWGEPISKYRKIKYLPLRSFETLVVTVIIFTLILTLSLPTFLITLDSKATYWSGYRGGTFFHLLIFNFGFTAYLTLAFARNFSSSTWNQEKDY